MPDVKTRYPSVKDALTVVGLFNGYIKRGDDEKIVIFFNTMHDATSWANTTDMGDVAYLYMGGSGPGSIGSPCTVELYHQELGS